MSAYQALIQQTHSDERLRAQVDQRVAAGESIAEAVHTAARGRMLRQFEKVWHPAPPYIAETAAAIGIACTLEADPLHDATGRSGHSHPQRAVFADGSFVYGWESLFGGRPADQAA